MHTLVEHNTWSILDSTKLQDYITCPRMYFYRYILGWRPEGIQIDLVFGSAWHKAMAILLEEGYSNASLNIAIAAFEQEYRKSVTNPADDEIYGHKIPANAIRGLVQYLITYNTDKFKVIAVEVAGSVQINSTTKMHYRLDGIVQEPETDKVMVLEHKTGSSHSAQWQNQWALKVQIGAYAHVLYCLYPEAQIAGVQINGFFPHNPPLRKRDGTPYANSKDNEFARMLIHMPPSRMNVWLHTVNIWAKRLEQDMYDLMSGEESESHPIMRSFVMSPESCSKYRGCPYRDFCVVWENPLQRCSEPPIGFIEEHWDPRDAEKEAKMLKNLSIGGEI